jgi:hypothetical protein
VEVVKEGAVNTRSTTKGTNIAVITMTETVVATGAIEMKMPKTKIDHGDGMSATTAVTTTEAESMARMTSTKTRNVASEMIGVVERTEATEVKVLMIAANTNDTAVKAEEGGVTEAMMTKAMIGENEGTKTTVQAANVIDGRKNTQVMMTIAMKSVEVRSATRLDRKVANHEGSVTRIGTKANGIEGVVVGVLASLSRANVAGTINSPRIYNIRRTIESQSLLILPSYSAVSLVEPSLHYWYPETLSLRLYCRLERVTHGNGNLSAKTQKISNAFATYRMLQPAAQTMGHNQQLAQFHLDPEGRFNRSLLAYSRLLYYLCHVQYVLV